MRLELNRALSVYLDRKRRSLCIAQVPPKAMVIENYVDEISALLEYACQPRERMELVDFLRFKGLEEAAEIIDDLQREMILVAESDPVSRYDRHQLYFSFFGVDGSSYVDVLTKKSVGILGVGGIGSNCASILAAAGIGRLVLCDTDAVELSNLTRTTLFTATDVGLPKVVAARQRIAEHNAGVDVRTLAARLDPEAFGAYIDALSGCEFLILSSDVGPVHVLTQKIAACIGARTLNAGYVDTFGVVGPLLDPSERSWAETNSDKRGAELNHRLQAPSYGPLNHIVAASAANETLRSLLGLPVATLRRRMLIDSATYAIQMEGREHGC